MNEEMVQQMMAAAERLASATEALDRVLGKLDAQQEMLNAKVDRIVAAVEENISQKQGEVEHAESPHLENRETWGTQRIAELEKANADLKAQAARMARKTLSPVTTALLGKNQVEGQQIDAGVLDKTLSALSVEQRIAVKAELARAGMIE